MLVFEPCNFVSNLAYYQLTNELCTSRSRGEHYNLPPSTLDTIGASFTWLTVRIECETTIRL